MLDGNNETDEWRLMWVWISKDIRYRIMEGPPLLTKPGNLLASLA